MTGFPSVGATVAITLTHVTPKISTHDRHLVTRGQQGVVLSVVEEWHGVHVRLESGEEVWVDPEDLTVAVAPGDVIAHDLRAGAVNLQQVVAVSGYGVTMRAVDGVEELHPVTAHTSLADVLAHWRPATPAELSRYLTH